ncbi:MAG: GIY-YIG nuclease family protein [Candidatus Marinimicrobia bacterium]|nr:GIY-YIG nuclease family protein [Candidatus Neomarinimicrobiota bacterium]
MNFTVYIIISLEGYTYVGYTNNLNRRLTEHNSGKHGYIKKGSCWKVIYSETCSSRKEARKREKYLKSHAGKERLKRRGIN